MPEKNNSSKPEKVVIGNATLYLADCMEVLPMLQRVDPWRVWRIWLAMWGIHEKTVSDIRRRRSWGHVA